MEEVITDINWLAVIVGFVISYVLGGIWYYKSVFGAKWASGVGLDPSAEFKPTAAATITQALGTFGLSWVVGITAKNDQLITLILVAVTLVLLMAANAFFIQKSAYARHTEAGFIVAMVVIMVACQGLL